jgi:hypothetical protein
LSRPIFTPYYVIPIDMLSPRTLLLATLGLRGERRSLARPAGLIAARTIW